MHPIDLTRPYALLQVLLSFWIMMVPFPAIAEGSVGVLLGNAVPRNPHAIARTHDDNFIIAGVGGAAKIDSAGNVKWRYTAAFHEGQTDYYGAAVLSDDSVILCGSASDPALGHSSGAVARISEDGKVLGEQLLVPQNSTGNSISYLFACMVKNDETILVGTSDQFLKNSHPPPPMTDNPYYWMLKFGRDGKMEWEKLVPVSSQFFGSPDSIGPLQSASDGGFFFAARRGKTEIVHVSPLGDVEQRKILSDPFTIVRPAYEDTGLQVISSDTASGKNDNRPITLITFNDDLEERSRITENFQPGIVKQAYRLQNGTLALFGARYEQQSYLARVISTDALLKRAAITDFPTTAGSSWWVDAAVPTSTSGQFASVRSVVGSEPARGDAAEKNGVVLDFVGIDH
jgi:hypothetical protein